MGTTATNLHVLPPRRGDISLPEEVERAYGRLGYRKPGKADAGAAKKVIVAGPVAGGFVTIRDSDNDAIDTGELKDLAVALSKRLETVAILTSVYDSDNFEFIVWRAGKQVDAAVDDESRQGDLKIAKGARRVKLWHEMFLDRDGNGPAVNGARAKISDGLAFWESKLRSTAVETQSPFAEDRLLRWCAAAGVDGSAALARMANGPPPGATVLELVRTAPPQAKPSAVRDAAPLLAAAREDEDLPYHRFYPAAWPLAPDRPARLQWYVTTPGGFRGARLMLGVDAASSVRFGLVRAQALPFYNGQVTSITPVAEHAWPVDDVATPGRSEQTFEAQGLAIPASDPQSRKSYAIILSLDLQLPPGGEAVVTPSFAPLDPPAPALSAPSLRLTAHPPAWRPLVSEPPSSRPAQQNEAILRLNAPAVRSLTAIFDADGAAPRSDFRELAEAFLGRMSADDFVATVHTKKHMTMSGTISKATRSAPLAGMVADRPWAKLFDAETDYQTVTVEIARPNALYPLAGFVMQAGLRGVSEFPGRPRATPLNGAIWSLEDPRVERELGLGPAAVDRLFDAWIERVAPGQAWRARAAWIPEFDTYEDTSPTLYERARNPEWSPLAATESARPPVLLRRLRFVTPCLWLGPGLAAAVDRASLERVALVSTWGATLKIELRPEFGLRDLEQVLAPIL